MSQQQVPADHNFAEVVKLIETARQHTYRAQPGLRHFFLQNIFRMPQIFDAYRKDEKLSTMLRKLPWSFNLHTPLANKKLLQAKVHKFYTLSVGD